MSEDDRYRRFNLRIPRELFAKLQAAADARSHSMNAEIIQRLEETFGEEDDVFPLSTVAKTAELYKNAYDLHNLALATKNKEIRASLEAYRDELVKQFELLLGRTGMTKKMGSYPWEES